MPPVNGKRHFSSFPKSKRVVVMEPNRGGRPRKALLRLRAALYRRVSTEEQAKEGFSLQVQAEKTRAYAEIHGLVVQGEYEDDGYSGRNTRRPGYRQMMADIDQWDILVVMKGDRIHRNARNHDAMMDELDRRSKKYASVLESFDTSTAYGRMFRDLLARMAQLESELIAERVGYEYDRRAKGKAWLGPAGYGYIKVDGNLVIVESEARWVRLIFQRLDEGRTLAEVQDELVARKVPPPHFGRAVKQWAKSTVSGIATNPKFVGDRVSKRRLHRRNNHPAIVGRALFNRVQNRLSKRREKHPMWTPGKRDA